MTRCTLLDGWFDHQSARVDELEKKTGIDFFTGEKLTKRQIVWRKVAKTLFFMK